MLLNSTSDIKKYFGTLAKNTSFLTLEPFVAQATDKYLLPVLSAALLAELEAGVKIPAATPNLIGEIPDQLSTITLEGGFLMLYRLVAASLAYYTVLEAMPFLNLAMGNLGTQEQNVSHMAPVRQWTYNLSENAAAESGDRFLDQALLLLENNAALFPSWTSSEAYTVHSGLLITNTKTLSRYLNIQNSRRAFLAFRPYLERAEALYIAPELGEELTANLKTGNLTPELTKLLAKVQPALAQYALAEALPEISLSLTGGGIRVLSDNDSIRQRLAAGETQIGVLSAKAIQLAQVYMAEVKRTLDTITQTGESAPADKKQTWQAPDNTNSPSFWV